MPKAFSVLERNIIKTLGVTDEQVSVLEQCEIASKADLATVGMPSLLAQMTGLDAGLAAAVMDWAMGRPPGTTAPQPVITAPTVAPTPTAIHTPTPTPTATPAPTIVVDSADVVHCFHCKAKQPKDYKSGDMCGNCGKQAEPVSTCFWCASNGPGAFCRQCGAKYVPTGELEIAVLLKREGLPKADIPGKLEAMSQDDKNVLWGRVRRGRG